ncbi:DNA ligase [Duganella sp. FT92W]|uniref:DNA ligase n=1 Tax=Pseudoduganella rivuli TaxID=2666085 RepID=A0A7X2LUJ5_9BURK|nr:RNA ligase family protein [Pseudoduganella rivuli]MRV72959.1 DNA ligase [Pseudoduganella rivuli]
MTTKFIQNLELYKYPRTAHVAGSRLQQGDEGHVPYSNIAGRYIVVEEKLDGGNAGVSFSPAAELLLQSRGHYLTGGGRERQFNLFKSWATAHEAALLEKLEDRYIMYGEWMHKKHSVFYDRLPAYFNEFDIWDRSAGVFLSTAKRGALLADAPVLAVPVLYRGAAPRKLADLMAMIGPSLAKSPAWRSVFEAVVAREGLDLAKAWKMADKSDLMEGLYIKVEEAGHVVDRLKLVRSDFTQAILDADQHHAAQPFIPNQLADGVDIFAPRISVGWPGEAR